MLTDKNGCPVAVEVIKGSTSDQTTVYDQVKLIAKDFGIKDIIFTGDRGKKRREEVNSENFKTITALTHSQIERDGTHDGQRWTFKIVIERLKSIRKTECLVNGILVKHEISVPDAE